MLDPTALLIARELLPVREASLTAHSGRLVPHEYDGIPMIIEESGDVLLQQNFPSTKNLHP